MDIGALFSKLLSGNKKLETERENYSKNTTPLQVWGGLN
jgi:hypothetical protein